MKISQIKCEKAAAIDHPLLDFLQKEECMPPYLLSTTALAQLHERDSFLYRVRIHDTRLIIRPNMVMLPLLTSNALNFAIVFQETMLIYMYISHNKACHMRFTVLIVTSNKQSLSERIEIVQLTMR